MSLPLPTPDEDLGRSAIRTLSDLARTELVIADGNVRAAAEAMNVRLRDDEELRMALIEPALEALTARTVMRAMHLDRAGIWQAASKPKTNVAALVTGVMRSLMDFPLAGGLKLRDATLEDVAKQADFYIASSRDMAAKARWLSAVAAMLPDAETVVGVAIDEATLTRLHAEAVA